MDGSAEKMTQPLWCVILLNTSWSRECEFVFKLNFVCVFGRSMNEDEQKYDNWLYLRLNNTTQPI